MYRQHRLRQLGPPGGLEHMAGMMGVFLQTNLVHGLMAAFRPVEGLPADANVPASQGGVLSVRFVVVHQLQFILVCAADP